MMDPRFFPKAKPVLLKALCQEIGVKAARSIPEGFSIAGVAGLDSAGPSDVCVLHNKRYLTALHKTQAGAVIVEDKYVNRMANSTIPLVSDNPHLAFARAVQTLYPPALPTHDIHPSAYIDDRAVIGENCQIEAGAFIGAGAEIGDCCSIGANAMIGPGVVLGRGSKVGACASLEYCLVGLRTNIHPGVRIGTRGFGFATDSKTGQHIDLPQLGRVIIGDDVEIGANSTIDRGMGPDTKIGSGTRIDNMVHVAHNVKIGRGCILTGMVGIAGSAVLEDFVVMGGQSGVSGHLHVGRGAHIAARAGVIQDVPAGAKVGGFPAQPLKQWLRQQVFLSKLAKNRNVNNA